MYYVLFQMNQKKLQDKQIRLPCILKHIILLCITAGATADSYSIPSVIPYCK
uniref:Uncharacterized protein n=1 Tax=Anguilla anguilla TaxID=7936 RepID=A0A0E9RH93_ANGAN